MLCLVILGKVKKKVISNIHNVNHKPYTNTDHAVTEKKSCKCVCFKHIVLAFKFMMMIL